MHFALTSVAVNQCWVAAELYVEQILIGVTAVTQARCQAVLQSSIEQWGMHFALTSVRVSWCCVTADMYVEQIVIVVNAVTQACCQAVFHSNSSGEPKLP